MITFLAIAVPVTVFLAGCAAIMRHRYRDDDPAPFNWDGTVPAGPGLCSCGAPHAKLAPFPGDPGPAERYITASDVLPGLVAALTPPLP